MHKVTLVHDSGLCYVQTSKPIHEVTGDIRLRKVELYLRSMVPILTAAEDLVKGVR